MDYLGMNYSLHPILGSAVSVLDGETIANAGIPVGGVRRSSSIGPAVTLTSATTGAPWPGSDRLIGLTRWSITIAALATSAAADGSFGGNYNLSGTAFPGWLIWFDIGDSAFSVAATVRAVSGDAGVVLGVTGPAVSLDTMHCATLVRDGTTVSLYVNGELVGSSSSLNVSGETGWGRDSALGTENAADTNRQIAGAVAFAAAHTYTLSAASIRRLHGDILSGNVLPDPVMQEAVEVSPEEVASANSISGGGGMFINLWGENR